MTALQLPRRQLLASAGLGFGSLAFHALTQRNVAAAPRTAHPASPPIAPFTPSTDSSPLVPKLPQIAPRARQVIFLFQYGGPSSFDLLDYTLVIWAGEFGRTPMMQGNQGRNHNPYGFTIWMAGGGVQAGKVIGTTDEIGLRAADSPQTVRNLHATILTALGIQPDDLYFNHLGRQERLTGVAQSWNLIPGMLGT